MFRESGLSTISLKQIEKDCFNNEKGKKKKHQRGQAIKSKITAPAPLNGKTAKLILHIVPK